MEVEFKKYIRRWKIILSCAVISLAIIILWVAMFLFLFLPSGLSKVLVMTGIVLSYLTGFSIASFIKRNIDVMLYDYGDFELELLLVKIPEAIKHRRMRDGKK